MHIRPATDADMDAVCAIYALEVRHGTASFELQPPDAEAMRARRRELVKAGYPYLVAEVDAGVVGYAYAGPWRARPAYRSTVEDSVYTAAAMRRRGVADALLGALIKAAARKNFRRMIAIITLDADRDPPSRRLHRKHGFTEVGTLSQVGRKHGRNLDTLLMQRALDAGVDDATTVSGGETTVPDVETTGSEGATTVVDGATTISEVQTTARGRRGKFRLSIAAAAILGLGGLTSVATGVTLYLGLSTATVSTRALLLSQVDAGIDDMEARIAARLAPVPEQGRRIAARVIGDNADAEDNAATDAFVHGALAVTPSVSGIAMFYPGGAARIYRPDRIDVLREDWRRWGDGGEYARWIARVAGQESAQWTSPVWAQRDRFDAAAERAVIYTTPLRRGGEFVGVMTQLVPITELSRELSLIREDAAWREGGGANVTPFVLYGGDRVLAHPLLREQFGARGGEAGENPLPFLSELGDPLLSRIDEAEDETWVGSSRRTEVRGLPDDDEVDFTLFLLRRLGDYGEVPWTVGYYLQLDADNPFAILARTAIVSGAVFLLAVLLAVWAGRRIARPTQRFAKAAAQVQRGELRQVPRLPPSRVRELDAAAHAFNAMVDGLREREVIRNTLGRYVPAAVAADLIHGGGQMEPRAAAATVLFADVAGFTNLTEALGAKGIVEVLNAYFSAMAAILERHRGIITQFQGDALLATFNVPITDPAHAEHALGAAVEMIAAADEQTFGGHAVGNRIGIATGNVVAGPVGASGRLSYTVHGDAVNLAARLEQMNKRHGTRVLISDATAALLKLELRAVGEITVRGQSRPVRVWTV